MKNCIFCKIVKGEMPAHIIWEDDKYIAFLSIFPNTEGFTVVATKEHYPSYAFDLPDNVLSGLSLATKRVAKLLDRTFDDVGRTGMFFEGFGVDHVHSKLYPMHGTGDMNNWRKIESEKKRDYYANYPGYLSSNDGPPAKPEELEKTRNKIIETRDNAS